MKIAHRLSISAAAFLIGLGSSPVLAQTLTAVPPVNDNAAVSDQNTANGTVGTRGLDRLVDQDLTQQQRIEQGLKDGQLTTAEAARLERGEAQIDQLESNALSNGSLSDQEAAQIRQAEYGMNSRITQLENNNNNERSLSGSVTSNLSGAPSDAVNDKMTADVQREINQQERIDRGLANGSLTPTEVSALESGQATIDTDELKAGRNDDISAAEQQNIRAAENTQSTDIYNDKHNGTTDTTGMNSSGSDRDHWRYDRDHFAYDQSSQSNMPGDNNSDDHWNRDRDHDHFADGQSNQSGMTGDNDFNRDDHAKDYWVYRHDRDDYRQDNHFANNGQDNDQGKQNELSGNVSSNQSMSGEMGTSNVTASDTGSSNAIESNNATTGSTASTSAATGTNVSANAAPATASTGVTAGDTASVTPASTPTVAAPHVAPPHIPVAHK